MKKVEFDYQVNEDSYRECSDLEKILDRKFFYGKAGFNISIDERLMTSMEDADKLADCIRKLDIRNTIGEKPNALEIFALRVLAQTYSD